MPRACAPKRPITSTSQGPTISFSDSQLVSSHRASCVPQSIPSPDANAYKTAGTMRPWRGACIGSRSALQRGSPPASSVNRGGLSLVGGPDLGEMGDLVAVADIDPLVVEQLAVPNVPEHGALGPAPEERRRMALGVHLLPVRL